MEDEKTHRSLVEQYALPAQDIEPRSFAIIDDMLPPLGTAPEALPIVRRVVHTTGDPSLAGQVVFHPAAVQAGVRALKAGCVIITDVHMVEAGISRPLTDRLGCSLRCVIDTPQVAEMAISGGTTRAVAAMRWLARPTMSGKSLIDGAVVAIGNAPTALLALLDMVDAGAVKPALIVGVPVGFVAAAESKEELMERDIPYITLPGTRGGSTIAVAIVNALLRLATAGR
jgi:precorrin-8X/cobalt-precorrin-8 methylmutase